MSYINIAVDGHSASGKSTVCDLVAKKLNINHLSSGALYRAIALYLIRNNIDYKIFLKGEENFIDIKKILKGVKLNVTFENFVQKIILNNEDVTNLLNTSEISFLASNISQNILVRELVMEVQKKLAKTQNIIIDGRDITSVVLKNSKNKFFITASIDSRAKRRYLQYNKKIPLKKIKQELLERDFKDETREISPLKIEKDAIIIDTTNLTTEKTVDKLIDLIKLS